MREKINDNIYRLTLPFEDVFTSVFLIKSDEGAILFDAASYDEDAENEIIPFLKEVGVTPKYIFISHNHDDHSGGLKRLVKEFPEICIVSGNVGLKKEYSNCEFYSPEDNDMISGVCRVITIPGHTEDSIALLDERTKTLITGDCLQLYGLFGSGEWGANITFLREHRIAVEKIRKMDISEIFTAHDYHPYGYYHKGKEEIERALDMCIEPLDKIKKLITENPEKNDEEIRKLYNPNGKLPVVGLWVIEAIRKERE